MRKTMKKTAAVFLGGMLFLQLVTGCGVSGDAIKNNKTQTSSEKTTKSHAKSKSAKKVDVEKKKMPQGDWQIDAAFPDWQPTFNNNLTANNRLWFTGFRGQGSIFLTPEAGVKNFDLYINEQAVDTSAVKSGETYQVNIASLVSDGRNTLQVSNVEGGRVSVRIPYPTVIEGTLKDVGISKDAIDLIDKVISADIDRGFSSAQMAIIKDGKLVYEEAWGKIQTYDDAGNPVGGSPVTKKTLYDLSSVTKMYSVNYAIQYLRSVGNLDLDTRIVDILGPEFANQTIELDYKESGHIPVQTNRTWKASITIKDLMQHHAGFPAGPNYYNDHYDVATNDPFSKNENVLYAGAGADAATREKMFEQICRTPLMYAPGTQTVYSDVDYMTLCFCVERITGKPMDQFLSEIFWEPMNLKRITFNPLQNGFTKDEIAATSPTGNTLEGRLDYKGIRKDLIWGTVQDPCAYHCMAGVSGHSGMFSNATDLAKLASVMLTGGYGQHRFFTVDTIDLFTTPKSEDAPGYGFGWWLEGYHDNDRYFGSSTSPRAYGHLGFTGALTYIDPDENLVVVLLTNKVHSPMIEIGNGDSNWQGNYYTTSTLGFASEIIEMGVKNPDADRSVYASIAADMAADARRKVENAKITDEEHPSMKTLRAMEDVAASYE